MRNDLSDCSLEIRFVKTDFQWFVIQKLFMPRLFNEKLRSNVLLFAIFINNFEITVPCTRVYFTKENCLWNRDSKQNAIFEECKNPIEDASTKVSLLDQNNRRAHETKHRRSRCPRDSAHRQARCRSQGVLHFVILFHVLGHMQISGSVTARDRPRSGFKFKFLTARVPAPVTGLTFPRCSLRLVHLSPLSNDEDTCFPSREEQREGQKKGYKKKYNRGVKGRFRIGLRKPPSGNSKSKIRPWRLTVNYRFREPWEDHDSRTSSPAPITRILISPCSK